MRRFASKRLLPHLCYWERHGGESLDAFTHYAYATPFEVVCGRERGPGTDEWSAASHGDVLRHGSLHSQVLHLLGQKTWSEICWTLREGQAGRVVTWEKERELDKKRAVAWQSIPVDTVTVPPTLTAPPPAALKLGDAVVKVFEKTLVFGEREKAIPVVARPSVALTEPPLFAIAQGGHVVAYSGEGDVLWSTRDHPAFGFGSAVFVDGATMDDEGSLWALCQLPFTQAAHVECAVAQELGEGKVWVKLDGRTGRPMMRIR